MTRYARKMDTNHSDLANALRAIPGMKLLDTSGMAGLGCDLLAALQGCRRVLLTLTDRDPWGDGCAYNAGELAVMQLRGAG